MSEELKPCPFCGSIDIDPKAWSSTDSYGPGCNNCQATNDSAEAWNKRVSDERLKELSKSHALEIEMMREANNALEKLLKTQPFDDVDLSLGHLDVWPQQFHELDRIARHRVSNLPVTLNELWTADQSFSLDMNKFKGWKMRSGIYGEPVNIEETVQKIQSELTDKRMENLKDHIDNLNREIDEAVSKHIIPPRSQSTAQQVLDFFTSRSPCRVVVCLSTEAALQRFFFQLPGLAFRADIKGLSWSKFYVTKKDDRVSYIVGCVGSSERCEFLLGHHCGNFGDFTSRTMAVINSSIPEDCVQAMRTWAGLNIIQLGDNDAKEGNDGTDESADSPTVVR